MNYDSTYAGAVMRKEQGEVYTLRPDGKFAYAGAVQDFTTQVILTGYTAVSPKGNTAYQTTGGGWIFLSDGGWQRIATQRTNQYSQAQAQKLVQQIINNNIIILQCNLVCARYASLLTASERNQVRTLQRRLEARNNALQAGGLTTQIKTSHPSGYAELSDYLDRLMAGEEIGIASWAVVVIAATVIAATATAAYFSYKALADESAKDVKYSKDLTATLMAKLTPEEYNQLMSETKGIVTKSRLKQMVSSYGNVLWIAGIGVGGVLLYRWLQKHM